MRKLSIMLLAAATVLLAACKEDLNDTKRKGTGGEATLTISTAIPNSSISTYSSGEGGVSNLNPAQYDLRYTLEIYNAATNTRVYRDVLTTNNFAGNVEFNTVLPGDNYIAYLWADFVLKDSTSDLFYNASDLTQVKLLPTTSTYTVSENARDAYYSNENNNITVVAGQSNTLNLTLHRPFGKIRFIATDVNKGHPTAPGLVKVDYNTQVPATFDVTGKAGLATQYVSLGKYASVPTPEPNILINGSLYVGGLFGQGDYYVLAYDYIFPNKANPTIPVIVEIYDSIGQPLGNRSISAVPVVENKLTTIIGNFYTGDAPLTISVSVDDYFNYFSLTNLLPALVPAAGATYPFLHESPLIYLSNSASGNGTWVDGVEEGLSWIRVNHTGIYLGGFSDFTDYKLIVDENLGGERSTVLFAGRLNEGGKPDTTLPHVFHTIKQEAAGLVYSVPYNIIPGTISGNIIVPRDGYISPFVKYNGGQGNDSINLPHGGAAHSAVNFRFKLGSSVSGISVFILGITPTSLLIKNTADAVSNWDQVHMYDYSGNISIFYSSDNQGNGTLSTLDADTDYYLSIGIKESDKDIPFKIRIVLPYVL